MNPAQPIFPQTETGAFILARSVAFAPVLAKENDSKATEIDIQWMPPGVHTIQAGKVSAETGKVEPVTLKVRVSEETAEVAARSLKQYQSADLMPYLDFNHEDGEASAHVLSFYWGGDDPVSGGVRAKVRLTQSGFDKLHGGSYTRFSPGFVITAQTASDGSYGVEKLPPNMGGFVNRPAFTKISPVQAGATVADTTQPTLKIMDHKKLLIALLGLTETASDEEVQKAFDAYTTKNMSKEKEIVALQQEVTTYRKQNAAEAVKVAVARGALPPANKEIHAKWQERIEQDPTARELLDTIVASQPSHLMQTVIKPTPHDPNSGANIIAARTALVDEFIAKGMPFDSAWRSAKSAKPELFHE